jgi:hypothetical protein
MNENENKSYPADVVERLSGYAEKMGIDVGEAANQFNAWLKAEFLVEQSLNEDPFYLRTTA